MSDKYKSLINILSTYKPYICKMINNFYEYVYESNSLQYEKLEIILATLHPTTHH